MQESYINIKQYLEVCTCSTFASGYDTLSSHKPTDDHGDTQCQRVIFKKIHIPGKASIHYRHLRKSDNYNYEDKRERFVTI
jgi:hypothetical protein